MTIDLVDRDLNKAPASASKGRVAEPDAGCGELRRLSLLAPDVGKMENFSGPKGLGLDVRRSGADEI